MIVDTGLTDGYNLGVHCQFPQGREKIEPFLRHIGGVDADRSKDPGESLRESHRPAAALNSRADRNDTRHPCLSRPLNDRLEIGLKVGIVEVGVGIDQLHQDK